MALLFCDSFDGYTTTAAADLKWDTATFITALDATAGQFGGGAARMVGISSTLTKTIPASTTLTVGGACNRTGFTNDSIFRLKEGTTFHVDAEVNNDGSVTVNRGLFTVLGTTSPGVVRSGGYQFLEMEVVIHDTTGAVKFWVDGVLVLNLSGIDTRNGGTGVINTVEIRAGNSQLHWDDCYILDGTGSAPYNTALGPVRIDLLRPDGAGTYTEFGTSTGTHWQDVDDASPDGDTTKITSTAANQRDTFSMENLSAITSQTIFGVQQFAYAKHDGTATNFRTKLRIAGTDYNGASQAGGASYTYFHEMWDQDPNAGPGAWLESVINGMESGVESL